MERYTVHFPLTSDGPSTVFKTNSSVETEDKTFAIPNNPISTTCATKTNFWREYSKARTSCATSATISKNLTITPTTSSKPWWINFHTKSAIKSLQFMETPQNTSSLLWERSSDKKLSPLSLVLKIFSQFGTTIAVSIGPATSPLTHTTRKIIAIWVVCYELSENSTFPFTRTIPREQNRRNITKNYRNWRSKWATFSITTGYQAPASTWWWIVSKNKISSSQNSCTIRSSRISSPNNSHNKLIRPSSAATSTHLAPSPTENKRPSISKCSTAMAASNVTLWSSICPKEWYMSRIAITNSIASAFKRNVHANFIFTPSLAHTLPSHWKKATNNQWNPINWHHSSKINYFHTITHTSRSNTQTDSTRSDTKELMQGQLIATTTISQDTAPNFHEGSISGPENTPWEMTQTQQEISPQSVQSHP